MERCGWVSQDQLYIDYHDREWGVPETDGKKLFEMICLEGQQAGLSWITVLKKRENYRNAFHQFDPVAVAAMTDEDVERLVLETTESGPRGTGVVFTGGGTQGQATARRETLQTLIEFALLSRGTTEEPMQ